MPLGRWTPLLPLRRPCSCFPPLLWALALGTAACAGPGKEAGSGTHVDVLIVGAGPAGLAAAWEAEQAGRTVQVVDGRPQPGGRARWGQGLMLFGGTTTQARAGITDSPADLEQDWPDLADADAGPWVQAYAHAAPHEVHDWLIGMGVSGFDLEPDTSRTRRIHKTRGGSPAVVQALLRQLDTPVRTDTWVTQLSAAPDGGFAVTGRGPGGPLLIASDALVIATGSILGELDRAAAYAAASPCPIDPLVDGKDGPPPADADGMTLLSALPRPPAQPSSPLAVGLLPHLLAMEGTPYIDTGGAVWVDGDGRRFVDERTIFSLRSGRAMRRLDNCTAWAIFDAETEETVLAHLSPTQRTQAHRDAALVQANSIAELAEAMGAEAEVLRASLAASPRVARPMRRAPYTAARLALVASKSFSGVETGLDGAVLASDGSPIPGLYAAGELTGMAGGGVSGPDGFDGSLGLVLWSGRVAGRHASQ